LEKKQVFSTKATYHRFLNAQKYILG